MKDFKVTPWEVSGSIDYEKLIKQFGTSRIDEKLTERLERTCGSLHPMLQRGFFFSHRDLNLILDDYEKGKGFFLYTGRKPSKGMHIGHMVPLTLTKWLQDKFKCNLYIEITDDEGFLHKRDYTWSDVQNAATENIADIAALGFDPDRTFIFKDSEYIKNMYPLLLRAAKKITGSTVKAVFGFDDSTNIGLSMYPAIQTIPSMFEKKRCLIPCAIDQDNYWRIQRDIAEGLGFHKTSAIHSRFLPPLQGVEGKMSSSAGAQTAILLTDDEKQVKKKINKYAFSGGKDTVEEHRKLGGDPTIDVPFQWLSIMFEGDDKKLAQIREDYTSGKILSGEMKGILIEKVNEFLVDHRTRKENAEVKKMMYSGKLAKKMWDTIHE
ncbi:tryptophan--tRNA ligase [Candidatus Micrarchaeota archaeon]|nr:tryptophan--tRNA ligase [Candidatus Micrarchaeota archaeon]MBU1681325.1 tryptophan--tRNA ligase [Candidatus Micrarchaeota archaeon]